MWAKASGVEPAAVGELNLTFSGKGFANHAVGRQWEVALYTGNDKTIFFDLLSQCRIGTPEGLRYVCLAGPTRRSIAEVQVPNRKCLNSAERLSSGQVEEIDRVQLAYPQLNDDAFVAENPTVWLV